MAPIEYPNYHFPPPISKDDFELGCMDPSRYSGEEISKAVIDNIERLREGDVSPRQLEAARRIQYNGTINLFNPEDYNDLWKWFRIYNDLFFGGLLKGFVRMVFFLQEYTRERCLVDCDGYTKTTHLGDELDPRFRKEKIEVLIAICNRDRRSSNAKQRPPYLSPFKRAKLYQETLLHEMLHALFRIYECECDDCHAHYNGCHDRYWQAAAERVENNGCLGWDPKLDRLNGLIGDLIQGYNLPNGIVLHSIRLDIWEILKELGDRREDEASEKPSVGGTEAWENMLPFKTNRCIRGDFTVDAHENAECERLKLRGKAY